MPQALLLDVKYSVYPYRNIQGGEEQKHVNESNKLTPALFAFQELIRLRVTACRFAELFNGTSIMCM